MNFLNNSNPFDNAKITIQLGLGQTAVLQKLKSVSKSEFDRVRDIVEIIILNGHWIKNALGQYHDLKTNLTIYPKAREIFFDCMFLQNLFSDYEKDKIFKIWELKQNQLNKI